MRTISKEQNTQTISVTENAARRLRGAIMFGEFRPGQKLIEADLCADLGISRASLREVLRSLEAERLVELIPNKGPSVVRLGFEEVTEIHDVWSLLTGEAAYRFTGAATAADVRELQGILERAKRVLRGKDIIAQINAINSFFWYVGEKCGNKVLIDFVHTLVSRLNFLRAQSLLRDRLGDRWARELEAIAQAVRARQPKKARRAATAHIASLCDTTTRIALSANPPPLPIGGRVTRLRAPAMNKWSPALERRRRFRLG
jgi:GntR family transcriptional regulator, trigonelline degradation regulator